MIQKRLLLVFFFLFQLMFGQEREAVLVFKDSTEVKGLGQIKNDKIHFRVSEDDKTEIWDDQIVIGLTFTGYGFSERYEYVQSDKYSKPVIMELLDQGLVYLYREMDGQLGVQPTGHIGTSGVGVGAAVGFNLKNLYFIRKKGETKAMELSFSFKTRALRYFSDCEIVVEKINSREFTKNNIPELVNYYNNYCGE
ncbi:MAG: hypothetical protein J0L86_11575 [Flavobacteriales bacterium]|nr:hypothetical protein [Flavobacteriales bacterium]